MNEHRVNVFKQNRFMGNTARRMIMEKCKYEGTGIWNGRCIGTKEVDPCPGYDKCKKYKPNYTTNADYIRSMSDEKLALFVRAIISAECCPGIDCDCNECFFKEPCFNGPKWHGKEIEWLQQPAEG